MRRPRLLSTALAQTVSPPNPHRLPGYMRPESRFEASGRNPVEDGAKRDSRLLRMRVVEGEGWQQEATSYLVEAIVLMASLLTPNEEIHVLQIVREALSNTVRHADASRARVHLAPRGRGARRRRRPRTAGPRARPSHGLTIMRSGPNRGERPGAPPREEPWCAGLPPWGERSGAPPTCPGRGGLSWCPPQRRSAHPDPDAPGWW